MPDNSKFTGPVQPSKPNSRRRTGRGPRSVTEFGPIAALSSRAYDLDRLDRQLRQSLPSPLREQVRLADVRDGRLVFLAPTSAWASRLRLAQAQLLSAARAQGTRVESVIVKVAPLPPVPEEPAMRKPLSQATADHLRSTAASLSDPEMRALFLSLASIADGTSPPDGTRQP